MNTQQIETFLNQVLAGDRILYNVDFVELKSRLNSLLEKAHDAAQAEYLKVIHTPGHERSDEEKGAHDEVAPAPAQAALNLVVLVPHARQYAPDWVPEPSRAGTRSAEWAHAARTCRESGVVRLGAR